MWFIYQIVIRIYYWLISLLSIFNKKAALWLQGRKNSKIKKHHSSVWFHFASLGEFEQGRPVLEQLRATWPQKQFVVTFFSPSGFEVRKNTPLADAVYYLPLDTPANAATFIATIDPEIAIFTKYEYWYCFFSELHRRQIPLYVISGIFRPGQIFFKWYGKLHRRMLRMVSHFFVQDDDSKKLLLTLGIDRVTVSGDTRFDRVWTNTRQAASLPLITTFKNNQKLFIGGSTWPPDEDLLISLLKGYSAWKFILAPHEIGKERVNRLMDKLTGTGGIRFSDISGPSKLLDCQVLVIDNIGMLSSLYHYADIAYIGGGFGAGIHNTLEAAAAGIPVIFGPRYQKFREARELIAIDAGFSIKDGAALQHITAPLMTDDNLRRLTGQRASQYVSTHTGATQTIVNYILGHQVIKSLSH